LQRVWLLVPPLALLALVWLDLEQVGTMRVAIRKEVPIKSRREKIVPLKIFACVFPSGGVSYLPSPGGVPSRGG
jgi:hypothetical protein